MWLQAERQRIDSMRLRWLAETRRKTKARDAERRAAAAAENAKHKEKTDTEDVLVKYALTASLLALAQGPVNFM